MVGKTFEARRFLLRSWGYSIDQIVNSQNAKDMVYAYWKAHLDCEREYKAEAAVLEKKYFDFFIPHMAHVKYFLKWGDRFPIVQALRSFVPILIIMMTIFALGLLLTLL